MCRLSLAKNRPKSKSCFLLTSFSRPGKGQELFGWAHGKKPGTKQDRIATSPGFALAHGRDKAFRMFFKDQGPEHGPGGRFMKQTVATLQKKKRDGEKIAMITAYDYTMARLCNEAGVDMILVGDSLGMVMLGYEDTVSVTMEDMIHHSRAVARGSASALVVTDMPFMSYRTGREEALRNAGRLLAEGRAQAVKLEGGAELADLVRDMVCCGIPVVGHLGLTPQSVNTLGGYRVQAREEASALRLLEDARALEAAGVFALVLECVPSPLAALVTQSVSCITIGIGAGPHCDGQVLVGQDLLAMYSNLCPRFVRHFAEAGTVIRDGVAKYCACVRDGSFPGTEHSFAMDAEVLLRLRQRLGLGEPRP